MIEYIYMHTQVHEHIAFMMSKGKNPMILTATSASSLTSSSSSFRREGQHKQPSDHQASSTRQVTTAADTTATKKRSSHTSSGGKGSVHGNHASGSTRQSLSSSNRNRNDNRSDRSRVPAHRVRPELPTTPVRSKAGKGSQHRSQDRFQSSSPSFSSRSFTPPRRSLEERRKIAREELKGLILADQDSML